MKNYGSQLKTSILLEITNISKSLWIKVFGIIWIMALIYNFFLMLPQYKLLGDSLCLSSYIIQVIIFLGIFTGFFLVYFEKQYSYEEIFISIPNAYFLKYISKIICLFIMTLIIFLTSGILYTIVFFKVNEPWEQYIQIIKFLLYYWTIPFFISGLIGYYTTLWIHSKKIYGILILFGMLLGPIISIIFEPILNIDKIGYQYISIFNLGVIQYNQGLNTMFGYPVEQTVLNIRLFYIIGLLSLIFPYIAKYQINKWKKFIILITSITSIICIGIGIFMNYNYISEHRDINIINKYSVLYEKENKTTQNTQYQIQKYSVTLEDNHEISAQVSMDIQLQNNATELNFNLYSGFYVKKILVNGIPCEFSHTLDEITVNLNEELKSGKNLTISFIYNGKPFTTLYKSSNNWTIPAFISWLPNNTVGNSLTFSNTSFINFNYTIQNYDIEYDILYTGKHQLYCSLEEKEKNHWTGKSNVGVTIGSTLMSNFTNDGIEYYYPQLYTEYEAHAPNLIKEISTCVTAIKNDFNKEVVWEPKKIFFLSELTFRGHGDQVYFFKDHMIIWLSTGYLRGEFLYDSSISYLAVVNQLLKTPAWEEQTEDIVDLFIYSYAQLLLDRNIISEEYPIYTLQDIIDLGILSEESTQNLGIKIKKYLETHDKNQSIHFLKSYYNLINSNEIVTVNDIIRLMEK